MQPCMIALLDEARDFISRNPATLANPMVAGI
jgi:hypothetical protein